MKQVANVATPGAPPFCTITAEARKLLKDIFIHHGFSEDSVQIFDRITLIYSGFLFIIVLSQPIDDPIVDIFDMLKDMEGRCQIESDPHFISDLRNLIKMHLAFYPKGTC